MSIVKEYCLKYKGRRVDSGLVIKRSIDLMPIIQKMYDLDTTPIYESLYAIFLSIDSRVKGYMKISEGGLSSVCVDVRKIAMASLECLASSVVIVHNHPSNNLQPSIHDDNLTKKVGEALNLLDTKLADHVIINSDCTAYYSYLDSGRIK